MFSIHCKVVWAFLQISQRSSRNAFVSLIVTISLIQIKYTQFKVFGFLPALKHQSIQFNRSLCIYQIISK